MDKKVKIEIVNATELKPEAKYILVLDNRVFPEAEAYDVVNDLRSMGIKNCVAIMAHGDVSSIKIIEQS